MGRFFLTGDIHGEVSRIVDIGIKYKLEQDDVVVILGDAGINYFLNEKDLLQKEFLSDCKFTIFCIHGNHEERPFNIPTYKEKEWNGGTVYVEDEFPNLLFAKDGEVFNFNGKSVLVIGGAYSVDKEYRLQRGFQWFKDEQPSKEIIKHIEEQIKKQKHFDIVLSHTCPISTQPEHLFLPFIDQSKVDKTTEMLLQRVSELIDFDEWYFGHFHGDWDNGKYHMLYRGIKII